MPSIKDYNYCWGEHGAAGARRATSQKRWHRLGARTTSLTHVPTAAVASVAVAIFNARIVSACGGPSHQLE